MAIIVDPDIPKDFVLPSDEKKPKKDQTVFQLKPMTGREFAKIAGVLAMAQEEPEKIYDLLKISVVGWERLRSSSGGDVPFSIDSIDLLPIDIASTLAEASLQLSGLTPEDAGK
jgi:hypothetical protein